MEISRGDTLFLDTNVLLTATDASRRHHGLAREVISSHPRSGVHLGISGQIIREYLVVATRSSDANGLGLNVADALKNAAEFRRRLLFFEESEAVSDALRMLAGRHRLTGARIHDGNVAATMLAHGLSKLITDNQSDFTSFSGIQTANLPELHGLLVRPA
jgi:predicted nucleic acid-binding protein